MVTTDVRALLGDDTLLNRVAADAFREYNTSNMITADLPPGAPSGGGGVSSTRAFHPAIRFD